MPTEDKTMVIIIGLVFLFVLASIIFGVRQSPEQIRANAYYDCIRVLTENNKDLSNCNQIK